MEFVPSVYEHAARLLDMSPWEVSRNPTWIVEGHCRAYELYLHRPIVIGIDIYNLEAEAYGAKVERPAGNGVPAITKPLFERAMQLTKLKPLDPRTDGRIATIIAAARQVAKRFPEADVRVPLSGPFSIAANLLGMENLLCDSCTEPGAVRQALHHLAQAQCDFCRAVVEQGLDIAFFESAAAPPFLSGRTFREIEMEPLKTVLEQTAEIVGHPVPCIIGGDTVGILDAVIETGTSYVICPAETNQVEFMEKMKAYPEVRVRINLNARIVASNDLAAVRADVDRVIELAAAHQQVCVGTGALPYETDPETVVAIGRYIADVNG